eukprot:19916-Heterococcus_DN1.PRE.2
MPTSRSYCPDAGAAVSAAVPVEAVACSSAGSTWKLQHPATPKETSSSINSTSEEITIADTTTTH